MSVSLLRAALLSASVISVAVPAAAESPRKVPLVEQIHGIAVPDEYRWMEDPANKEEMVKWVEAEGARTRAKLDAMPVRAEFEKLIADSSSGLARIGSYSRAGGTEAYTRANASTPVPLLYVRVAGAEKMFLDPGAGGDKLATINEYQLSPDGKYIAVNVASAGAELTNIQIYEVASGAKVGAPIERIWGEFTLGFLPGGKIVYTQIAETPVDASDPMQGMTAWVRDLAGGTPTKVLGGSVGGANIAPKEFPLLVGSPSSPFVIGIGGGARADNPAWVATAAAVAAGKPEWKPVATLADKVQGFGLRGDDLFLSSTKANGAGEIMVHKLAADGAMGPATIVFAGRPDLIITSLVTAKDGVYVSAQTDGVGRIFFSRDGRSPYAELTLPFEGDLFLDFDRSGTGAVFTMSGWFNNSRAYQLLDGKVIDTGLASENWSGAADFISERKEAVSADGTKVPMVVLRSKKAVPAGGVPTLVEAYGGYGINTATPFYFRDGMAWIAKGGAIAFCGTRGGGERGRDWHEAGRGPNKPRGQEDLIACARTLTAAGIAPKQGPVSYGASMAGALVPVAALRAPDAFGAMITGVGVVNMARIGAAENGANQFDEVGNPADPAQFKDLLAMDAYHQLLSAKAIPDTMMTIGLTDRRVAPWMSAKFVARAHDRFPGMVMLRSEKDAGHGIGTAETTRRSQIADMWTFAWSQQMPE
ncbi:MAG: prolyl oligopeptidase family serine peptidase [Sphingopyxis sp.]|nr:prolyl oligopeptidase family serine peptidase [Sphingopyxis sp.]